MFGVSDFFTITSKKGNSVTTFYGCEFSLDRLMVGYAFRVFAFCDANDFMWHYQLFLLDYFEALDYIDCSLWGDKCEFVEFFVSEEHIGYLDDTFLAIDLAGEVDTDGDLALYAFEVKDIECLIYVFRRDVVQYGTVFQCAYY